MQKEQELNELLPSLLDKAFKGELFSDEIAESFSFAVELKASHLPISSIPENKKGFAKQVLGGKIVSLFNIGQDQVSKITVFGRAYYRSRFKLELLSPVGWPIR